MQAARVAPVDSPPAPRAAAGTGPVGRGARPESALPAFSIRGQYDGATVFLTGASGYVGSLVLEQLLRETNVARVLLLLRAKRGQAPQERVAQLMKSGLFHHVRDRADLTAKVRVLAGDISKPELGLSAEDRALVADSAHFVVHSAASIELEADIHDTLRSNFLGTRSVALLAAECRQLRAMVHVSTAYVNINLPRSSVVHERIYGLRFGDQPVDAEAVAQELLGLPNGAANERAQMYIKRWNFPNTYCLGKHLVEEMLERLALERGVPACIVRPSFVTSVARQPYPGYVGNWAGPLGVGAAMAVGMFPTYNMVAGQAHSVWDAIPGDLCASIIIAAGAAQAAGAAPALMAAADAARAAGAAAAPPAAPLPAVAGKGHASGAIVLRADSSGSAAPAAPAAPAALAELDAAAPPPPPRRIMVVHACTSTTYPITMVEAWNLASEFIRAHPAPLRISAGRVKRMKLTWRPDQRKVDFWMRWTGLKVRVLNRLLSAVGQGKQAKRLVVGFRALEVQNHAEGDSDLSFATQTLFALEAAVDREELGDFVLTWRARPAVEGPRAHPLSLPGKAGKAEAAGGEPVCFSDETSWRRYTFTTLAGIYRMFFGVVIPGDGPAARGVEHDFRPIK